MIGNDSSFNRFVATICRPQNITFPIYDDLAQDFDLCANDDSQLVLYDATTVNPFAPDVALSAQISWPRTRAVYEELIYDLASLKEKVCVLCEVDQFEIKQLFPLVHVIVVPFPADRDTKAVMVATWLVRHFANQDADNGSVDFAFSFPSEVAAVAEQYLIYFGRFLSDLGLSATTSINHTQSGNVQVSVTPTDVLFSSPPGDYDEAIEKIREALAIYLCLPAVTPNHDFSPGQEIAIQQMQANIDHLRSQLRLAAATMQQQQISINLLSQQGPSQILLASEVTPPDVKKSEKVELLGGAIKLGDLDLTKGGVVIGLGDIYRIMREKFGKKS
ncbi:hypothetical protein CCAX7_26330 [Capsulimonas corticalis]|uniref:Uncharacterized protein n=1 Tax=Capsulimonas corticalis TaxID=2219043 RepID=A0A402D6K0_9BACT|nr:hypothetical protein CCAX7_26330 [Capsulimonas corticalis]